MSMLSSWETVSRPEGSLEGSRDTEGCCVQLYGLCTIPKALGFLLRSAYSQPHPDGRAIHPGTELWKVPTVSPLALASPGHMEREGGRQCASLLLV